MSAGIKKENLSAYNEAYQNSPLLKAMSNVLTENDISTVASVHKAKAADQFHFSLDIKTLPVANQMASGRCWLFAGLNVLREAIAKKYDLENFEHFKGFPLGLL